MADIENNYYEDEGTSSEYDEASGEEAYEEYPEDAPEGAEDYPDEDAYDEGESDAEYDEDYGIPEDLNLEDFYYSQSEPLVIGDMTFDLTDRTEMAKILTGYVRHTKKQKESSKDIILAKSLRKEGFDEEKVNELVNILKKGEEGLAYYLYKNNLDFYNLSDYYSEFTSGTRHFNVENQLLDEPTYRFQETISEVLETPTGHLTVDFVNKWDDTSKYELLKQPIVVHTINNAYKEGIMDKVIQHIERTNMEGWYAGLNDIQKFMNAFREVSSSYVAEDSKKILSRTRPPRRTLASEAPKRPPAPKSARAAIPRKGGSLRTRKRDINNLTSEDILRMKHEDFVKLFMQK